MKPIYCVLPVLLLYFVPAAFSAVLYVDPNSPNATARFATWGTAATNIQDAIDTSTDGDDIVVTNGIYQTRARTANGITSNRVAVTKPVTVESVNGPLVTIIQGYQVRERQMAPARFGAPI